MFFKIVKELTPITSTPLPSAGTHLSYTPVSPSPLYCAYNLDNKLPDELLPQNN